MWIKVRKLKVFILLTFVKKQCIISITIKSKKGVNEMINENKKGLLTDVDFAAIEKCDNAMDLDMDNVEVVDVAFTYGEHRIIKAATDC